MPYCKITNGGSMIFQLPQTLQPPPPQTSDNNKSHEVQKKVKLTEVAEVSDPIKRLRNLVKKSKKKKIV